MYLTGAIVTQIDSILGTAIGASGFKVPEWLSAEVEKALVTLYKRNLAFFLLKSDWEK
jgi:hypothetical protein